MSFTNGKTRSADCDGREDSQRGRTCALASNQAVRQSAIRVSRHCQGRVIHSFRQEAPPREVKIGRRASAVEPDETVSEAHENLAVAHN